MKTYEAMFLLDAGQPSFESAVEPIQLMLGRYNAEILQMKKWDERRLAYDVKGRRRGLYVLAYFKAAPETLSEIENDAKLSDQILRVLILSADHVSAETMAEPTPAESGTGGDRDDRRRRRDDDDRPPRRRRDEDDTADEKDDDKTESDDSADKADESDEAPESVDAKDSGDDTDDSEDAPDGDDEDKG